MTDLEKVMGVLRSWKIDSDKNCSVLYHRYKSATKGSYARRKAKAEWDYMSAQSETIDNVIYEICEALEGV